MQWESRLKIESTVYIAGDPVVCSNDLFDLGLDEEIEGVDVLFDQALDLQKCREKIPFILLHVRKLQEIWSSLAHLGCGNGVRQALPPIEWFK